MKIDEKVLIEKSKAGDFDAFEKLLDKYEKKVYNIGYSMMRNSQDAEEVLQETFLKVFDKLHQFKEKSLFSTWLYRIATNEALMLLRKRKPVSMVSLEEPLDDDYRAGIRRDLVDWSTSPQDLYLRKEFQEKIDEVILTLPENYRAVFVLRDIQGLPAKEVSEILDITVAAVKARLHRARLYAREVLNKYFKESMVGDNGV